MKVKDISYNNNLYEMVGMIQWDTVFCLPFHTKYYCIFSIFIFLIFHFEACISVPKDVLSKLANWFVVYKLLV